MQYKTKQDKTGKSTFTLPRELKFIAEMGTLLSLIAKMS